MRRRLDGDEPRASLLKAAAQSVLLLEANLLLHSAKLIARGLAIWRRKPCPATARLSCPTFISLRCRSCASPAAAGALQRALLMEQHGDAKLTDLLQALAACPKARSAGIHDRCKAAYGQLLP